MTSYLTNETSFQESWIERFALIIVITMYYLFEIVNVTRKVYAVLVNEEKQKMKQRSFFGGIVKHNTKFYCIYKNLMETSNLQPSGFDIISRKQVLFTFNIATYYVIAKSL